MPDRPTTPVPDQISQKQDNQIVTIPDRFYAASLKMEPPFEMDQERIPAATSAVPTAPVPAPVPVVPPAAAAAPSVTAPAKKNRIALILLPIGFLLLLGGVYVLLNWSELTAIKAPPVQVKQNPANAPGELSARGASPQSVSLSWQDRSSTETGFRIERKEASGNYTAVSVLPSNSTVFLDVSVSPGSAYAYRVIAVNDAGDSAPSNEASVATEALPAPTPTGPTLPPDGLDSDSDGLTDVEERNVFTSNDRSPDSDGDSYLDANEAFNLYDPSAKAPAKLIASSAFQVVTSTLGWQLLVPKNWTREDMVDAQKTIFRTSTGEVFVLEIIPFTESVNRDSIGRFLGIAGETLVAFESNKYRQEAWLAPDRLTLLFPWKTTAVSGAHAVVKLQYELQAQSFVNYRTTFGILANSLRLEGAPPQPDLSQSLTPPAAFVASSTALTVSSTVTVATPTVSPSSLTASSTTSTP